MTGTELNELDLECVSSGKEAMYRAQGLPPSPYNKIWYTDDFDWRDWAQLAALRRQWRRNGSSGPPEQYLPNGRPLIFGR
jgi:hypothetical protein